MKLNEIFEYRNGCLYYAIPRRGTQKGAKAGWRNPSTGRWMVNVDNSQRLASRVIWEIHNGPIPEGLEIDHANRDVADDRIENLRLANRFTNNANTRPKKTNTSGFKGVDFQKRQNLWRARIRVNGRRIDLGLFETPEMASAEYIAKARMHFGEFAFETEAGE